MIKKQEVYVIDAVRTPVAKAKGVFKSVRPDDLLSHALKNLLKRNPSINPIQIEDIIIGCAMPEGEQGMNIARISSLLAGIPNTVPAMTINRFCASGLQSIAQAAMQIKSGFSDLVVAGGVESMSRIPMGGFSYRANPKYFEMDENIQIAYGMGITAEKVAKKWQISREEQDNFALESHEKATAAIKHGKFVDEIAPFNVVESVPNLKDDRVNKKELLVEHDTGPRNNSNLEAMAKLPTVFSAIGTVTAANTSQMSDGAAALLLASEDFIFKNDITPLAKFKSFAVAGVEPQYMGIGPIAAIPKSLAYANLSMSDLSWIELNEAFAAQSLAVINDLGLDKTIVNPYGGAIALGHPLGATGAIKATTLLHGMRNSKDYKAKYGMVTMCIGTGMGAAGIFESI